MNQKKTVDSINIDGLAGHALFVPKDMYKDKQFFDKKHINNVHILTVFSLLYLLKRFIRAA